MYILWVCSPYSSHKKCDSFKIQKTAEATRTTTTYLVHLISKTMACELSYSRLRVSGATANTNPLPPRTHTLWEQQRQSKILSHVGGIVTTAEKCRPRNFKSVFIIFLPYLSLLLYSLSPCIYFSLQFKPHTLSGLILFNEKWEWINGRVSSECPANESEFPFDKTTRGTIKYCIYFKWLINDFKKVN